ncbi:sortase [Candidatus Woesebacteria bacterium]|nr:sortase [Candidatus Woesebacteria bacterium]
MPRKTKKEMNRQSTRPVFRTTKEGRVVGVTSTATKEVPMLGKKQANTGLAVIILFLFGCSLMGISALHFYLQYQSLSLARSQVSLNAFQEPSQAPFPVQITVPGKIQSAIETMPLVDNKWGVSPTKTAFLQQSARPGEAGNIILYGHNRPSILGNLHQVHVNDVITLTTSNGSLHSYKVIKRAITSPTQVELLQPTTKEVLTVYTCTGFLDSQRLIVQALPL